MSEIMATFSRDEYSIGWICALHTEYTAARAMLDEKHIEPQNPSPNARDDNHYTLGRIGRHNVVIGVLPSGEYGTAAAASVASNMISSFPSVRIGLMVGIGGGAPLIREEGPLPHDGQPPTHEQDIRLGDVVVSNPSNGYSGVIQYDYGKAIQGEDFQLTRILNQPPPVLRSAMAGLRSRHEEEGNGLEELVEAVLGMEKNKRLKKKYQKPVEAEDRLFRSNVAHSAEDHREPQNTWIKRPARDEENDDKIQVHYGLIATANTLMKDAVTRNWFAKTHGVLCFEMEAGGLMNSFPCLVIRGICDYCDTHKNKDWQGYAAMTAAVYTKTLINELAPTRVEKEYKIGDLVAAELGKLQNLTQNIITDKISDDVKEWISPSDPSTNLNRALWTRHKGSGQWILKNEAFIRWKERSAKALWLKGNAGCGKTVLSSTVIQHLQEASDNSAPLLYFYFDFSDSNKQTLEHLQRSLVHQLHSYQGDESLLHQLYESCRNKTCPSQPRLEQLSSTFLSMVKVNDYVLIVIDALDECTTRKDLLDWISILKDATQAHFLATSRPEYEIQIKMNAISDVISLENAHMNEDISHFIHDIVKKDESLSRWRSMPEVQKEIESALVNKAGGMFRWVSCQLHSLKDCLNYADLRKALRTLPETLDETYARILQSIPATHRPHTITILQFLSYSSHVFSLEELIDAITVSLDDEQRFNPKNRMPVPGEFIRYCSSLAMIVPTSGKVHLSHFSVKEWLLSDRLEPGISQYFHSERAHAKLAQVLLAMVIHVTCPSNHKNADRVGIHGQYPLAVHAARNWAKHAKFGQDITESVTTMALELLTNPTAYRNFAKLHNQFSFYPNSFEAPSSPLSFAAVEGLYESVKRLVEGGAKISKANPSPVLLASGTGRTKVVEFLLDQDSISTEDRMKRRHLLAHSLKAASANGHEDTVKFLIKAGADVKHASLTTDALSCAVRTKSEYIVKALLENGASQSRDYYQALELAATQGHEKILGLLFHYDQHKATHLPLMQVPLVEATKNKYESVVKLLIDYGVETVQDSGWRDALQIAIFQGHVGIMQCLINHEAKGRRKEGKFGRAIRFACRAGQTNILEMLLIQGADLNDLDNSNGGILESTCRFWDERAILPMVQILLDKGADVNASGGRYGNALQAASSGGYQTIVKLLLDAGANIDQRGGEHETALIAASYKGNSTIVQILLEHGADVNIEGGVLGNALQTAANLGHEAIVNQLLEYGALVNAEGGPSTSALQAAVEGNHASILKVILGHGALAHVETKQSSHPLLVAVDRHVRSAPLFPMSHRNEYQIVHEEIIMLLLDNGASPNARGLAVGGDIESPLVAATRWGNVGVVKLLLARGANVQSDKDEALLFASSKGRLKIAKDLLDRGADVNAFDQRLGTALQAACHSGNQDLVLLLLQEGAQLIASQIEDDPLLHDAALDGNMSLVKLLLDKGVDINAPGGLFGHALQAAAGEQHALIVKVLLERGADVNARGGEDVTALHAAVTAANPDIAIVKMLLKAGADVNASTYSADDPFTTALLLAAGITDEPLELCKLLLESGADVNVQAQDKNDSALHLAAERGQYVLIKLLLQYGAEIDALSNISGTPLQAASRAGMRWEVELLLNRGADVNAYCTKCKKGSALQAAIAKDEVAIVRLLIEWGADVSDHSGVLGDSLQTSVMHGNHWITKFLIKNGANINAKNGRHGSSSQAAVVRNDKSIVKYLIKKGADVNSKGGRHGSPLQAAVVCKRESIAEYLIRKGSDVNSGGDKHGTPLQAAVVNNSRAMARLLIEKGADVNSGGGKYGSPLDAANKTENFALKKLLLEHGAKLSVT